MDPCQKIEGISKVGFVGFFVVFLRPDCPRELVENVGRGGTPAREISFVSSVT